MSKKRKKKREAPMPMGGAGLIRFFQDETEGIKMGPIAVTLLAVSIIMTVVLAWMQTVGMIKFP
ncbi:MAG: preprotein translocase subunit Sec61beta [Candidatus Asgardarchaeia archaeon]|nr:MAG: preprotein translocase subunit Sec61beta [Candidatus Asgardarchaeum californiense]